MDNKATENDYAIEQNTYDARRSLFMNSLNGGVTKSLISNEENNNSTIEVESKTKE